VCVCVRVCVCAAEIDLKVASKFFGGRFACGSSVTGDDEIVIQGDVKDELVDVLTEKWPQVTQWPCAVSFTCGVGHTTPQNVNLYMSMCSRRNSVCRILVFSRCTLAPNLWMTGDHFVGKLSTVCQPTSRLSLPSLWSQQMSSNPRIYIDCRGGDHENGRLGQRVAVWLLWLSYCWLALRPRLNDGPVCDALRH